MAYYRLQINTQAQNMAEIFKQRMTSPNDDHIVVFLIGMRINKWWKVHQWLPVIHAMTQMLKELYTHKDMGLLSHENWFGKTTIMVQYWQSFEHLNNYAKNKDAAHLPAWAAFNRKIGSRGDVGIWHETYLANAGNYESIYNNMPRFGLAKAKTHIPVTAKIENAKQRLEAQYD